MGFAFRILLNIRTCRQDLYVLKESLDQCASFSLNGLTFSSRRHARNKDVYAHARSGETGDADNVVDPDSHGSHPLRNRRSQSAT